MNSQIIQQDFGFEQSLKKSCGFEKNGCSVEIGRYYKKFIDVFSCYRFDKEVLSGLFYRFVIDKTGVSDKDGALRTRCKTLISNKEDCFFGISEKIFCDHIQNELENDGWSVSREVKTMYGFIDILAEKESEQVIIEAKLKGDINSMSSALGQCLFYKQCYPNAVVVVMSLERIDRNILSVLSYNNINIFWGAKYIAKVRNILLEISKQIREEA